MFLAPHPMVYIRFARVCSHVDDFNNRNKILTSKLLKQGYRYHMIQCMRFPTTWYVRPASLRSACAYAQSDQNLCYSLEYSMTVKLLTEHHLEFLSFKGGYTCSSESTLVKMSNFWKFHVTAHIFCKGFSKLYYRHSELIVKYNICLKTLLQQGISEPVFYGDLVNKLKKMLETLLLVINLKKLNIIKEWDTT